MTHRHTKPELSPLKEASIDEVTYLFRSEEQQRPIVLLGAGASFSSGIPLAGPMVNEIAKWSYARTVRNTTPDRIHVRRSEWEDHLKGATVVSYRRRSGRAISGRSRTLACPRSFGVRFFSELSAITRVRQQGTGRSRNFADGIYSLIS